MNSPWMYLLEEGCESDTLHLHYPFSKNKRELEEGLEENPIFWHFNVYDLT